ncbi:hypothetical protein AHMF7605_11715 [Adhaeribacter arboris]|uniref:Uncharacterized protein n=1 Tax=Adhaeribacter arboris TaxID=2072846 RepID=A0A2T2YF49_9BACT|nr:hypothetical protein [Adhaeribacter arboris]PSR54139.1 hypothetical protein AHMF7605_11715 [Adhaeribacter arboris]
MTKEQWQELYKNLDAIYSEYSTAYYKYEKGKNKQIRASGERDVDSLLNKANFYIKKNTEVYNLLTGGENNTDTGRIYNYDDFIKSWHFQGALADFLDVIKEKIESFDKA